MMSPLVMMVAAIGVAIFVISAAGEILWARKTAADQPRQARVLVFFLYFWLRAFIQLIFVAISCALLVD